MHDFSLAISFWTHVTTVQQENITPGVLPLCKVPVLMLAWLHTNSGNELRTCDDPENVFGDGEDVTQNKWLFFLPPELSFQAQTFLSSAWAAATKIPELSRQSGLTVTASPLPSAFLLLTLWLPFLIWCLFSKVTLCLETSTFRCL